jgi:hypothetical protein
MGERDKTPGVGSDAFPRSSAFRDCEIAACTGTV